LLGLVGKGELMSDVEVCRLKSCSLKMPCWARVVIWGDNEGLSIDEVGVGIVGGSS